LDLLVYVGTLNRLSHHRAEIEAIRYLDKLGLVDYTQKRVSELSKGMQQKIQFILAILHDPDILILDEPFAGIDPLALNDIKEIIRQLRERGIGIIISDHNVRETLDVCDSAYIINQGKIIEYGVPEQIVHSKIARSVYLGDNFNL